MDQRPLINGLWINGLWINGLWINGLWSNTLWQSGFDADAGVSQPGSPSDTLRSSPYLRQLLQYEYACAMPRAGTPNPDGGAPLSFDTKLDPNNGKLACTPPAPCDDAGSSGDAGSTCSSQPTCDAGYTCDLDTNTCVVPLTGAIGLAINDDGTHWWDPLPASDAGGSEAGTSKAGTCDESCQRWISACVLARTNAYGVHVEISMRAPAVVPPGRESQFAQIQAALATSPTEVTACDGGADPSGCGYTLREGAYYGNIFATTPVDPVAGGAAQPPTTTDGGAYSGPATGPIAETPSFYACAGPDSNIPEITKRFCSSQGGQVVINVPGVCVTPAPDSGTTGTVMCDGIDPTGSIDGCYTVSDGTGTRYDEVITVYLKQPIAVCGNGVCEPPTETTTSCPSDCHPGTWVKDYPNPFLSSITGNSDEMSAVAPDGAIVVAGTAQGNVDLGGGTLSASEGAGILAKYHSDGSYAWGIRFGNTSPSASGGQFQQPTGVSVASNGTITVAGLALESVTELDGGVALDGSDDAGDAGGAGGVLYQAIWFSTYTADGVPVGSFSLPVGSATSAYAVGGPGVNVSSSMYFAYDSQGNIVLAGSYSGTITLGSTSFTSHDPLRGYFLSQVGDVFTASVSPQGAVLWAKSLGGGENDYALSMVVDSADNIVLLTNATVSAFNVTQGVTTLQKLASDGSPVWSKTCDTNANYFGAAVDPSGSVYLTGYFGPGQDFGGGPITSVTGLPAFLAKYGPDGSFQWVNYTNTVCPPGNPNCGSSFPTSPASNNYNAVFGFLVAFDSVGDPVLYSVGTPAIGGGIDFGVGTFPTYGSINGFLAAYSRDVGRLLWAKQIPTILPGLAFSLAIDSQNRVVLSGQYSGSMQLDDALLVTAVPEDPNTTDGFLASFVAPSPADTTAPVIGAGTDQTSAPIFTVPSTSSSRQQARRGLVCFSCRQPRSTPRTPAAPSRARHPPTRRSRLARRLSRAPRPIRSATTQARRSWLPSPTRRLRC